jgi:hypothetical protein
MRHGHHQTLAFWASPMAARHLGRSAGLVNKDQVRRVQAGLLVTPGDPRGGNVGTLLLGGVRSLFLRVSPRALR